MNGVGQVLGLVFVPLLIFTFLFFVVLLGLLRFVRLIVRSGLSVFFLAFAN